MTGNSSEAEIDAVATLLYHCGVSTDMRYSNNGSTTDSDKAVDALVRYFNYSKRLHREKRADYTLEEWTLMLKSCLDLRQPVHYTGYGSQGSHAFVCDGYDANGLFHFNWGWGTADGYFSLGNLNPLGYAFNSSQSAIFDIFPLYEPCLVMTTVNSPSAGAIEGGGEYHIGEICTLIATPAEGYDFYCWKKDGQIYSDRSSMSFAVENDTINIEALFSCLPVGQITASYSPEANDPNSTKVSLSWNRPDTDWVLLKQFETYEEVSGLTTDGNHIFVTFAS